MQAEKESTSCFAHRILAKLPFKCCKREKVVACLPLSGVISHGSRSGISFENMEEHIEKAFKTPKLQAVALLINSPGGSPVQSELIYRRIRQLAEEKNVPVLAFAEDVAASGGYWLACTGDEIYASENSIIGSIGVISGGFGFNEAIKKLGIDRRVYTQGENKSILDPFMPEKASDVEFLKGLQKEVHDSFKALVRSRRGEKLNAPEEKLFSGEFWTGARAKEYGLIDHIGDFHTVIREKYGKDIKIVKIEKEKSWIKRKLGLGTSLFWEALITRLEEKGVWARFGM